MSWSICCSVETGVAFTQAFGDIDERFYNSMETVYADVIRYLNDEQTPEWYVEFGERLEEIVKRTAGIGWGFHDNIEEIHMGLKWLADDV